MMGFWSTVKAPFSPPVAPVPKTPAINLDAFISDKNAPASIDMLVGIYRDIMTSLDELHGRAHGIDARQWLYDWAMIYIVWKLWHL